MSHKSGHIISSDTSFMPSTVSASIGMKPSSSSSTNSIHSNGNLFSRWKDRRKCEQRREATMAHKSPIQRHIVHSFVIEFFVLFRSQSWCPFHNSMEETMTMTTCCLPLKNIASNIVPHSFHISHKIHLTKRLRFPCRKAVCQTDTQHNTKLEAKQDNTKTNEIQNVVDRWFSFFFVCSCVVHIFFFSWILFHVTEIEVEMECHAYINDWT